MFDIGMSELLLIGIVALIVVGPKDLPHLFHTLGRFTAKARSLGREFTRAMNDAAKDSGLDDVKKGLNAAANPKKFGLDALNGAAEKFEKWDPSKQPEKEAPKRAEMDEARAADMAKIRAATEKMGKAKAEREAAAAAAASDPGAVEAPPTPAKAPAKKPAKPAAEVAAPAKATAAKKPAAKKPAAQKPAAKKPAAKKPAAKKAEE